MACLDTVDILHCNIITIVILTFVLFARISKIAVANSRTVGWFQLNLDMQYILGYFLH